MELIRRRAPRNPGVKIVKKIFFIIAVLFCLVQALQWEINLLSSDNLHTERRSLKYYLTFPSRIIRKAPVISKTPSTQTEYSYGTKGGHSRGYESIYYESSESKGNIQNQLSEYLGELGYAVISKEAEEGNGGEWESVRLIFTAPSKPETEVVASLFHKPAKGFVNVRITVYHW
ncbi:hypothetical protein [Desulfatibacillum aliphaticivorans]|uniref:hypothetical protein n=1 Tax=Desulfatibacillum aliphaticivorans TaxID=218208 RepID=UPI00040D2E9F|nr:hypothetical protein [Desulfatibacillum aliphaticivorans]